MNKEWTEKGFVDEPVDESIDLKKEIRRLCKEKDAVLLAHYYTVGEVQEVADFIGDSLALARKAAQTDAKMIVMCGVHFMAFQVVRCFSGTAVAMFMKSSPWKPS
mgnify:CR=1 FL=1